MKSHTLNSTLVVLLAIGLVIPTAAVIQEDEIWAEGGLVLTPTDGPNDEYVEVTGGTLSVDLASVGVNPNSLTSVRDVFNLMNQGKTTLEVWITHNATDVVTFAADGEGSIQGANNTLTVSPGETVSVSLSIDTEGVTASDFPVLEEFQLHVRSTDTADTTPTAARGGGIPAPNPSPTPTSTPVGTGEDVEVIFDEPVEGVLINELPVGALLGGEIDQGGPKAVITMAPRNGATGSETAMLPPETTGREKSTVVRVGNPVTLSAAQSRFGSVSSIDNQRRVLRAIEITVPDRLEDTSATLRMRVETARISDSARSRPQIGRKTAAGWQLLPTTVVGQADGQLILEARTPGVGQFAVFAAPQSRYAWQYGPETRDTRELHLGFTEPGVHNATLTVIDALGRTDSTNHRLVVNDQPSVTIETQANLTAGEPLTLHANVTNEVGNTTVTWTFPDGSRRTGETVQYTFEEGDQTLTVSVEDEYGARTTVDQQFTVGPVTGVDLVMQRMPNRDILVVVISLLAVVSLVVALPRWRFTVPTSVHGLRRALTPVITVGGQYAAPDILDLNAPSIDVEDRHFEIGLLRIEDSDGDLESIEIMVSDERGREVANKRIDLRGRTHYVSRDHVITPKSRAYVRANEPYTFRVRAEDAKGERTGRQVKAGPSNATT